jgi:hypothetical protein
MTQLTPIGLVRILGQVTAIVAIPMVGGAVAGLILDAWLDTSPLCVLGGFAIGNVVAIVGIWLYIRSHARRTDDA